MKKKLLAILLTVCMVLSMAPAALAADSVFTDVKADDWFSEEVKYVYDNGLMNGVGDNTFDPSGTVTRAMVWTTLARQDGVNTAGSDPWWLAGQKWAMENGISDGTMATENITREQLVTMIWRYAKYIDMDVSEGENTNILSYTDALDVNEWAVSAMQWACAVGIINGIDGALQPQGDASRAMLAAILYRFVEEVMPEEEEPEPSTPVVPSYPSYPSIPVHFHSYKDWTPNNDGTHTGTCACTVTKTEDCEYGEYVSNEDGTHSRTCSKCNGVETEACDYTDHVCGNCGHDVSEGITILYPQETAAENYTMLKAAIDAAEDGDVIYLGAGTFELQTVLEIKNKSISIIGVEDDVVLKNTRTNKGHLFTIKNHTNPANNPQVIMTNITLDQNNNPSGHGIYVRGSVTVDLYDIVIKNATAASIIMDHAYAYIDGDGNYHDGTSIIVNANNVDLEGTDAFVQMGALPMSSVADVTTYAEFNYDSESTIPTVKADGYNRGYGNLTVNSEPLYPAAYFVEEDGIIYLKDTVNDELTLWKITEDYESDALVVPEGTTALNGGVFAGADVTKVTIPAAVTDFGATGVSETGASGGAFKGSDVTTVVLEEGMIEIPAAAFNGAKQLTSVTIPASVKTIGVNAFRQTALTGLTIPETVTTIKNGAFRDMAALTTVTVEGNVNFENYAFRSVPNLTSIYLLGDDVTFNGSQFATHSDNGDATGITIYVKNATVAARVYAAQSSAYGYAVKILGDEADGSDASEVTLVKNSTQLADAIGAGKTTIALAAGNFPLPNANSKNITLVGVGPETVVDYSAMGGYQEVSGSSFVFKNMTVVNAEAGYPYKGLQHITSVSYEDCHITGTVNLFAPATFTNCTFDSKSAEHNVVTYGSDSVTFTDCKFTYGDRAVNCYAEDASARDVAVTFTDCTFTKVAGKETTGAIETNSSLMKSLTLTINNCTVNEGELWFIAGWDSKGGAKTTVTVDGVESMGVVLVQSGVLPYLTLNSNLTYKLVGDFANANVSLVMPVGVENVIFDGTSATNINELIITQNGALIDNANTPVGERSGKVTVQNFNVLSQINVFACKTEVVVQENTAEALMVYAGNCDVKVLNNTIDANFESHPTYRDANNTWNTNNYGIALNIFDYNLWLDGNTVTDATGHAIGINGWETTIDNGDENVIESFKGNTITVNSTTNTKRAAFKVWDDETYASNDDDTNVINATAQAFIDAVLADGSNTFNIVDGYDHTIFSFYNVNTNN